MTRQQKAESLKRRYGRHGAPESIGPMGGRRHGPGRNMGMGPKRLPRNAGTTIRRLLHYLNEDKPKMMLAFFCVILNTAATLAGSYMLRPIINTFIAPLTGGPGDPEGLARALAVLAAVFAVGVFACNAAFLLFRLPQIYGELISPSYKTYLPESAVFHGTFLSLFSMI